MEILNAKFLMEVLQFQLPLKKQKTVFNILSGLRHRNDPINHIWKSPCVTLNLFYGV